MANIKPYRSRRKSARKAVRYGVKATKVGTKSLIVIIPMAAYAGHIGLRLYIRGQVKKGLIEEYQFAPNIMGRVFYTALYGKIPLEQVQPEQMKFIARMLARKIAPLSKFNFPTKESIGKYIIKRLSQSQFALLLESFKAIWGKTMKKPLAENVWLMAALTIVPVFGTFAGYRYWMRMRAKKYLLTLPPEQLYKLLVGSEPPQNRVFTTEEYYDMASQLAALDAPFWHYNYVKGGEVPAVTAQDEEE